MRIKSALYDTAIRVTPPLASHVSGEHFSLGNDVKGVHIHTKDAYAREEYEAHKTRALRHRNSELRPPPAPHVSGEHLSLGNDVIGVHIHSKDSYGREEHDTHKNSALRHRN